MGEAIVAINKYTGGDATTDVGQHQMIACRYAEFIRSKSNVTSGGWVLWDLPFLRPFTKRRRGSSRGCGYRRRWIWN